MSNFRIKDVPVTDDTPIFSLGDDYGDLTLYVEFADGTKEPVLYINEDGVNRLFVGELVANRLRKADIKMDESDRINIYV